MRTKPCDETRGPKRHSNSYSWMEFQERCKLRRGSARPARRIFWTTWERRLVSEIPNESWCKTIFSYFYHMVWWSYGATCAIFLQKRKVSSVESPRPVGHNLMSLTNRIHSGLWWWRFSWLWSLSSTFSRTRPALNLNFENCNRSRSWPSIKSIDLG